MKKAKLIKHDPQGQDGASATTGQAGTDTSSQPDQPPARNALFEIEDQVRSILNRQPGAQQRDALNAANKLLNPRQ